MKKACILSVFLLALSLPAFAATASRVALVTLESDYWVYSEDYPQAVDDMVALHGDRIVRRTLPANYMEQQEKVITTIADLAKDRLIKAIIVAPAVPGTAEAFRRVRAARPDIMLVACEPHEDPPVIQFSADLSVSLDWVARGYTIPWAARQLGAKTFLHLSFPRHMSYETLRLRRNVMELACERLGIAFVDIQVPDPTSDVGVAGTQQYVIEQVPQWIRKYGKDTVFFSTSDPVLEPLIQGLVKHGGMFLEADWPSPVMGYPGALGLDLYGSGDPYRDALAKAEKALIAQGASGRLGTWAYSFTRASLSGLCQYALAVADGTARQGDHAALLAACAKFTPGCGWNYAEYLDPTSGDTVGKHLLLYMDTYVFGRGYLAVTKQKVDPSIYREALAMGLSGSLYEAPDAGSGATPSYGAGDGERDKNGN